MDGTPLSIHVLTLGTEEHATKLKLMQVASKKPARIVKQPYIHTIAGPSYLTIFVHGVEVIMNRANKIDYKPYAKPSNLEKFYKTYACSCKRPGWKLRRNRRSSYIRSQREEMTQFLG